MHIPTYIDLFGFFIFAISGALAAEDKIKKDVSYDIFSVAFISFVTSIGGGTIRDLILGVGPVTWATDGNYLLCIFSGITIAVLFKNELIRLRRTFFLFDTIGIGLYTILGVQKAQAAGVSLPASMVIGMFSAVMGGVLRDVLINEIPLIFRKEIYATACLTGAFLYAILHKYGMNELYASWVGMLSIIIIRIIAVKYKLRIPTLPWLRRKLDE
ncbi:MAG: trimeric intracellular cation channel family protein [Bacteroidia bacterium]